MEFSVFRQVLIKALGHMQSIVEKRATLPILMNVKLEVTDNLILSATNVDLELIEHVPADITLAGKITVPVQMLYDIARKLPEDSEIKFKQSGDQLVVSSGRALFKLPTLPSPTLLLFVSFVLHRFDWHHLRYKFQYLKASSPGLLAKFRD